MKRLFWLLSLLILTVCFSAVTLADSPKLPNVSSKGIVVNPNPPRFNAAIWTDRASYKVGEPVKINFRSDIDGYAMIYDYTSDGRSHVIWPTNGTPAFVKAGRTYSLPDGNYSFNAQEPTGVETLVLVVSRDRAHLSFEWNVRLPFWEGLTARLQAVPADVWNSTSCSIVIEPRYRKSALKINAPSGTRIFINGRDAGTAPLRTDLDSGRYQIVGLLDGCQVEVRDINVKNDGRDVDVSFKFKSVRK